MWRFQMRKSANGRVNVANFRSFFVFEFQISQLLTSRTIGFRENWSKRTFSVEKVRHIKKSVIFYRELRSVKWSLICDTTKKKLMVRNPTTRNGAHYNELEMQKQIKRLLLFVWLQKKWFEPRKNTHWMLNLRFYLKALRSGPEMPQRNTRIALVQHISLRDHQEI